MAETNGAQLRTAALEPRDVLAMAPTMVETPPPHRSSTPPGCQPGCLDRWVELDWAGAPIFVQLQGRVGETITLRSPRMRIPVPYQDFEQTTEPDEVAVYLEAEITYQPHNQVDPDGRVQWLPTAIILDIDGQPTRFHRAGAQALTDAIGTLLQVTVQPATDPGYTEHSQPCPTCTTADCAGA